jgi:predicted small lipoprotein YifL
MILRCVLAASLALGLTACGTKSNLLNPDGKPTAAGQKDPSEPPNPITR